MASESFSSLLTDHDTASGVYRRDVIFRKLDELFQHARGSGPVVILLEIRRFKKINDASGPQVGDRIISGFARRLQRSSPDDAVVGRMSGDGFAIVLPTDDGLDQVVEQVLEISKRPFSLSGNVIYLKASMGIAIGPLHGGDAARLVHAADIALHTLHENSETDYVIFSSEMLNRARSMHSLESDFRRALVSEKPALLEAVASQQFEVFYQPQVSASTGRPLGVEALLRWHHPERGYIEPNSFIPLAEETGVMNLLGAWVLQTACRDIQQIRQQTAFKHLNLSVNISPRQFDNVAQFTEQLGKALENSGFPAANLALEVTEGTVLQCDQYEIERVLRRKCTLAIDDFGTGYSAMNVLRNLPVSSAKLDRVYVSHLFAEDNDSQTADEQMIQAFQHICSAFGIRTVIEGVETFEQAEYLSKLGCDELQGFYFSQPVPVDELKSYLERFEKAVDEQLVVSH